MELLPNENTLSESLGERLMTGAILGVKKTVAKLPLLMVKNDNLREYYI